MGKIYAVKINHMTNPMGFLMERDGLLMEGKGLSGKRAEVGQDCCGGGCIL